MIYGIQQSTDLRDRRTKITQWRSTKWGLRKAIAWVNQEIERTYPNDPTNSHHNLRRIYSLFNANPRSWIKQWKAHLRDRTLYNSEYGRSLTIHDFKVRYIQEHGEEITIRTEEDPKIP